MKDSGGFAGKMMQLNESKRLLRPAWVAMGQMPVATEGMQRFRLLCEWVLSVALATAYGVWHARFALLVVCSDEPKGLLAPSRFYDRTICGEVGGCVSARGAAHAWPRSARLLLLPCRAWRELRCVFGRVPKASLVN